MREKRQGINSTAFVSAQVHQGRCHRNALSHAYQTSEYTHSNREEREETCSAQGGGARVIRPCRSAIAASNTAVRGHASWPTCSLFHRVMLLHLSPYTHCGWEVPILVLAPPPSSFFGNIRSVKASSTILNRLCIHVCLAPCVLTVRPPHYLHTLD